MKIEGEHEDGRRYVGLYRPIVVAGQTIKGVTFKAMTYGHLISWQSGEYQNAHTLLMDLTGLTLGQIHALKRPDDERVIAALQAHVHPGIAADMEAGIVPISGMGGPRASSVPPAAGTDRADEPASEWAQAALRAADAAEARTAADTAEELRLSQIADAEEAALDEGGGPGYSGAFGGDPAT